MTATATQTETILLSREGGVQRIVFNNPRRKNALTVDMYATMADALIAADADPETRVVVFSGAEGCFTSGNDLMDFMKSPPTGESSPVARFLGALASFSKPIVAAVAGPAIGVGTTMLLHCDLVLADATARFRLPFVNLALVPEAASSLLLPELVGHRVASELLLLGDAFTAEDAQAYGIVNRVCAEGELETEALAVARRLAAQPPAAIRQTKALLKRRHGDAVAETMRREGAIFRQRLTSPEAMEAMQAFMAKRTPDFSKFS
jgi:enoyl-CoA hydratase/carnithine racemase